MTAGPSSWNKPIGGKRYLVLCHYVEEFTSSIYKTFVTGFTSSTEPNEGQYGIWAKFLGLWGATGDITFGGGKDHSHDLNVERLETSYFMPSVEYITKVAESPQAMAFVQTARYKTPAFLITGPRVAKHASFAMTQSGKHEVDLEMGITNSSGTLAEIGPKVAFSKQSLECE